THGVSLRPTGDFDGYVTNPGGMVSFSSDGTIWYAYGGRAQNLPMDLYSSVQPYEPTAFTKRLDDLDLFPGSTTPCVNVHDPKLLFFWRHANSGNEFTGVRCRRYDINGTFDAPEIELELSHSVDHEVHGLVGIEQLWTRHDPRFGYRPQRCASGRTHSCTPMTTATRGGRRTVRRGRNFPFTTRTSPTPSYRSTMSRRVAPPTGS
ncbi:MAG: hypothetical protein ACYS0J_15500, partial [Planctomycetota bacterium]